MIRYATLGYLKEGNKYLLGKKKYGGAMGKLNGFGGKVESSDDTFESALVREFKEETGLDIKEPSLCGTLVFQKGEELQVIYVYKISKYEGVITESDEMTVSWYDVGAINLKEMWPNDQIWFNLMELPFSFVSIFNSPKIDDYDTNINLRLLKEINENTYKDYI